MLGAIRMPEGYALMLDPDGMFFFWLRDDGERSADDSHRWDVRRAAIADSKRRAA
jgi:hypothetical protein